jgi:hypothetical protein
MPAIRISSGGTSVLRVTLDLDGERLWLWYVVAVLAHQRDMRIHGFVQVSADFIHRTARGEAAR